MQADLISRFIEKVRTTRKTISVMGDAMIDQYFSIEVKKISSEFPIVCFLSKDTLPSAVFPGGAANTAFQLKNFNVAVYLSCFYDEPAEAIFWSDGVDLSRSIKVDSSIPIKKRFYDGDFPVFRWDVENIEKYDQSDINILIERCCRSGSLIPDCDLLILSDYDKGLFSCDNFNLLTQQTIIPTIVDPKGENILKWKGCTVFKPNQEEAKKLSGKKEWKNQCKYFHNTINCQSVVITREGKGVVGSYLKDDQIEYFEFTPKKVQNNVNSVIGAGDAFTSILGLALVHNFSLLEAVEIAFYAGSVYVSKKYNTPITEEELLKLEDSIKSKFQMPPKNRDYKLIMTNGCFDILHEGHLDLLKYAKQIGDKLVVAVNSDKSVRRLKGDSRPINPLNYRMNFLASLEFVDYVVCFEEDTPLELINEIKPDVIVKSEPYTIDNVVGFGVVKDIRIFQKKIDISTTSIFNKWKEKEKEK